MPLLPEELKRLWEGVDEGRRTAEEATAEQMRLVGERRRAWTEALLEPGAPSLAASLVRELACYVGVDDTVVEARCRGAIEQLRDEWTSDVDAADRSSVERYYRRTDGTLYELLWWHALVDDESPLAYVNALELARVEAPRARRYLDFGSGVGSGGLLFARAGFEATLADISVPLLGLARWRFERPARA